MPKERPFGVLIIASALTVWGGGASFILAIEIIDSIRFYGLGSLMITSPAGLAGFILYAALPVIVCLTGIGTFDAKRWAYTIYYALDTGFDALFSIECHLQYGADSDRVIYIGLFLGIFRIL